MILTLPDTVRALFPFEPHWVNAGGFTLHYVDEGRRGPDAVVLYHGNPTWSFLYRKIIPKLTDAGMRVIAPDFLGSGRSDHGAAESQYAIAHHVGRTIATLRHAGVERAVMFCQDWGGPIGLGAALASPGLLRGLVLANTFWGEASEYHRQIFPWRTWHSPILGPLLFARRRVFARGAVRTMPDLSPDEVDAYMLPFQTHGGAGATLPWPRAISLGPGHPTHPLAEAIWDAMPSMDIPVRFVWGAADPVFPPAQQAEAMADRLPRGREHEMVLISGAGHFVQEWAPDECAAACIAVAAEALGR